MPDRGREPVALSDLYRAQVYLIGSIHVHVGFLNSHFGEWPEKHAAIEPANAAIGHSQWPVPRYQAKLIGMRKFALAVILSSLLS